MKPTICMIVAGLVLTSGLVAQSDRQTHQTQQSREDREAKGPSALPWKDSLTGCLVRGDESDPFVIRDLQTGKETTVVGAADLSQHVNHTVTIHGSAADQGRTFQAEQVDVVAPDCTTPARQPAKPDNTAANKQQRQEGALTAQNQKINRTDREITANIRRAVVADKSLSVYAHNVKIITRDGTVTLKGPVRSEAERGRITGIAAAVVSPSKVQDEITIAPGN